MRGVHPVVTVVGVKRRLDFDYDDYDDNDDNDDNDDSPLIPHDTSYFIPGAIGTLRRDHRYIDAIQLKTPFSESIATLINEYAQGGALRIWCQVKIGCISTWPEHPTDPRRYLSHHHVFLRIRESIPQSFSVIALEYQWWDCFRTVYQWNIGSFFRSEDDEAWLDELPELEDQGNVLEELNLLP
jgi:hypothetical protein